MPSECRTGHRFHGNFREANSLSQFLQFDNSPQQLCITWRRNLSAFQYVGLLFHRYTLQLDETEGAYISISGIVCTTSDLGTGRIEWNFASRNKKTARRRSLCRSLSF
jgi:hypothetical protein